MIFSRQNQFIFLSFGWNKMLFWYLLHYLILSKTRSRWMFFLIPDSTEFHVKKPVFYSAPALKVGNCTAICLYNQTSKELWKIIRGATVKNSMAIAKGYIWFIMKKNTLKSYFNFKKKLWGLGVAPPLDLHTCRYSHKYYPIIVN